MRAVLAALGLVACGSDAAIDADVAVDSGDVAAVDSDDVAAVDSDVAEVSDELDARAYCEATVDVFCPYYLRCGRMAVDDLATCRAVFLESCNARYEPFYAALADRGALRLSRAGLARCADHLADVACEQQIFDLDGGCDAMWLGQVPAGGGCGLGIESFVCDAGAACVIGLDFCGTCVPLAGDGPCDPDHRCPDDGVCKDGVCQPRAPVGGRCDDESACVSGASCTAGTCVAPTIVALGDGCDQTHRCPYRSACVAGHCMEATLLGEACGNGGCASGWCDGGTCAPLVGPGASCTAHAACVSGRCEDGVCAGLVSGCME